MIEGLRLEGEEAWISSCAATDVFYMNYLFIRQLGARMVFVPNLAYVHIVHGGSYWMNTSQESTDFLARIKKRIAQEF